MNKYKSHPHVLPWVASMNGELLTPSQLDVFDFICWCKKHGCRTSNDRIGSHTHRSHITVQRAIAKLYALDLIAIDNYGKRTRTLKPVPWPDRKSWENFQSLQAQTETQGAQNAPHISKLTKPPLRGGVSLLSSEPPPAREQFERQGAGPPTPPGCSAGAAEKFYQLEARIHRDKICAVGWTVDRANRIARAKYPLAEF
ncbi:hypothetical protein ES703_51942 [subsurface metagenome]